MSAHCWHHTDEYDRIPTEGFGGSLQCCRCPAKSRYTTKRRRDPAHGEFAEVWVTDTTTENESPCPGEWIVEQLAAKILDSGMLRL